MMMWARGIIDIHVDVHLGFWVDIERGIGSCGNRVRRAVNIASDAHQNNGLLYSREEEDVEGRVDSE